MGLPKRETGDTIKRLSAAGNEEAPDTSCLEPFKVTADGKSVWNMGKMEELIAGFGVPKDVAAKVLAYAFLSGWNSAKSDKAGQPKTARIPRMPWQEWTLLCASIYERDGFVCAYCSTDEAPFCIDHIVPISRDGTNDPSNLTACCVACNSNKSDKLLAEWPGRDGHRNKLPGEQCP